jgi:phosphatidylglycerol:prolipoprotein diacylglycerol transferase
MFPDLIDFGFIHIRTYGAFMAVGFLCCWTLLEKLSGRKDLSNLLMALMLTGIAGARAAYVIEHWRSEFAANPLNVIRVDQGGLMFYGGLIAAIIVFLVWCRVRRESVLSMADLLCTIIPLGHAFGRVGCFFYGCCYGRAVDSAFSVRFPAHSPAWYEQVNSGLIDATAKSSLPVLPTQLIEAAALLVLLAVLLLVYRRFRKGTAAVYLVGYGLIRFGLETLRGDPRVAFFGLSIGQLISIGVVALGIVFAAACGLFSPGRKDSAVDSSPKSK